MTAKDAVRSALFAARMYRPGRHLFERVFDSQWTMAKTRLKRFYSSFVDAGDLVFDVGANIGRRSEIFCRLGAKVIAIEPNPHHAGRIRAMCPGAVLEIVAVGAHCGEAELMICPGYEATASLSKEWLETLKANSPMFQKKRWDHVIKVPLTTLDDLIRCHGRPRYIKIDIEGYDDQALRGLSQAIPYMSFEFQPAAPHTGIACIERISSLGKALFNYTYGEAAQLYFGQWVEKDRILAHLTSPDLLAAKQYGDVFAWTADVERDRS